jgi:hypothetical protein
VRDEHYSPFKGPPPDPQRPETVTVFVMARLRGDETDSMRGSVRPGPHGVEAVYTLNGELYRSQWFASEARARADLATQQDALAAGRRSNLRHLGPESRLEPAHIASDAAFAGGSRSRGGARERLERHTKPFLSLPCQAA